MQGNSVASRFRGGDLLGCIIGLCLSGCVFVRGGGAVLSPAERPVLGLLANFNLSQPYK